MPARNHVKPLVQARVVLVRHGFRLVSAFVRWREAAPPAKASTRLGMSALPRPRSAVMLQSILDACIGVQCAIPTESHLVLWKLESDRETQNQYLCKLHFPRRDFLQDVCNETWDPGPPRADSSACGMQQQGHQGEETCEQVRICLIC